MYINVTIAGNIHIIKRMRNCTCFIILCSFSHRVGGGPECIKKNLLNITAFPMAENAKIHKQAMIAL